MASKGITCDVGYMPGGLMYAGGGTPGGKRWY